MSIQVGIYNILIIESIGVFFLRTQRHNIFVRLGTRAVHLPTPRGVIIYFPGKICYQYYYTVMPPTEQRHLTHGCLNIQYTVPDECKPFETYGRSYTLAVTCAEIRIARCHIYWYHFIHIFFTVISIVIYIMIMTSRWANYTYVVKRVQSLNRDFYLHARAGQTSRKLYRP